MHRPLIALVAAAALLALPATAPAQRYPAPAKPQGATGKPKGPFSTLRVCKRKSCKHRTIQSAVKAADAGDTIRVADGTYREGVKIVGAQKRHLKIIGNVQAPHRVVIQAPKSGAAAQNGVFINGADEITLRGLKTTGQRANGFFVTNATGYTWDRLIAAKTGVYGLYAFNTIGGTMTDSLAYHQRDGAYYIGQTPRQTRPKRSIVRGVVGWGSVIGFSATNMRYVTITESSFFNNAVGVVPNALDSEKDPPAEDNVIRGNDVFWNNFDVYKAAPFKANAGGDFVYPPGTGVILLSGRRNLVEGNRIWGNWLGGFVGVQNAFLKATDAIEMIDNTVRNNSFGLDRLDLNGRDMVYTGNGRGNCFQDNTGVETTVPNDPAAFPGCPGPDNQDNEPALLLMIDAGVNKRYRENWVVQPHTPIQGIEPLTDYEPGKQYGPTQIAPAPKPRAVAAATTPKRTVKVGDYFFAPGDITVKKGTRIVWKWEEENTDTHDVKLQKGPKGVKRFKSELAATGFSYSKRLRVPGAYTVICTLHPDTMVQKIRVRR